MRVQVVLLLYSTDLFAFFNGPECAAEPTIRLSVGIEDLDDLLDGFKVALG